MFLYLCNNLLHKFHGALTWEIFVNAPSLSAKNCKHLCWCGFHLAHLFHQLNAVCEGKIVSYQYSVLMSYVVKSRFEHG